jgi:hypothetical protein
MPITSMLSPAPTASVASQEEFDTHPVSPQALARLAAAAQEVGGAYQPLPGTEHAVAFSTSIRHRVKTTRSPSC